MNQLGQPTGTFNGDVTVNGNITANDGEFDNITVTGTATANTLKVNTNPVDDYTFPATRGLVNQILQTDGAGVLNWVNPPGGVGNTVSVIYYPGGTSSGNVYATWPEIISIIDEFYGAVTVYIDTAIQNPAVITDSFDGYGAVVIKPYKQTSSGFHCVVEIDMGVTISNLRGFDGAMTIRPNSFGSPSFIFDGGSIFSLFGGAVMYVGDNATVPCVQVPDNNGLIFATALGSGIKTDSIAFANAGINSQIIFASIINTNPSAFSNNIFTSTDSSSQIVNVKDASGFNISNAGFTGSVVDLTVDRAENVSYDDSAVPVPSLSADRVQSAIDAIKNLFYRAGSYPTFQSIVSNGSDGFSDGNNYLDMQRNDELFDNFVRFWNVGGQQWRVGLQGNLAAPQDNSIRFQNVVNPEDPLVIDISNNITNVTRLSCGTNPATVYYLPLARGNNNDVLKTDGSGNVSWQPDSGSVTGPGSSTDNALVRFDGTSGNVVKNSNVTLDNTDFMTAFGLHLNEQLECDDFIQMLDLIAAPATPSAGYSRIYEQSGLRYRPNPNIWSLTNQSVPFAINAKAYTTWYFSSNASNTTFPAGINFMSIVSGGGMLQNANNDTDYGTWSSAGTTIKWDGTNTRPITVRINACFNYKSVLLSQSRRFALFTGNPVSFVAESVISAIANGTIYTASVQAIKTLALGDQVVLRVENSDANTTDILITDLNYTIVEI